MSPVQRQLRCLERDGVLLSRMVGRTRLFERPRRSGKPVVVFPSHPDAPPLGWQGLACQLASAGPRLPVYALGGLAAADLPAACEAGAHGVALMRGAWA